MWKAKFYLDREYVVEDEFHTFTECFKDVIWKVEESSLFDDEQDCTVKLTNSSTSEIVWFDWLPTTKLWAIRM